MTIVGGEEHIYGRDWEELKKNWKDFAPTCASTFESAAEAGPCYVTTEPIHGALFHTVTMGRMDGEDVARRQGQSRQDRGREETEVLCDGQGVHGAGAGTDKGWRQRGGAGGDACADGCAKDEEGGGNAAVGETYVHGLMDGEAFNEKVGDGWESRWGGGWRRKRSCCGDRVATTNSAWADISPV